MDLAKTISLLHRKMNKGLNTRLMQIGLSNAQSGLLELLYYNGKMTQADLCEELKLDKSTVAKALDRMEQNGLVTKTVNPDDSRSFLVSPTQKAIETIPMAQEVLSSWSEDVTSGMTKKEKERFLKLIKQVAERAAMIATN
ncbi:MAG: MarR family winged helix-turn-helix transcriptional regulator [Christensenellales bacterium]